MYIVFKDWGGGEVADATFVIFGPPNRIVETLYLDLGKSSKTYRYTYTCMRIHIHVYRYVCMC